MAHVRSERMPPPPPPPPPPPQQPLFVPPGLTDKNDRNSTTRRETINLEPVQSQAAASGYRGVSWNSGNQKYEAQINVNSNSMHLGSFDTAEEAAQTCVSAYLRQHEDPPVVERAMPQAGGMPIEENGHREQGEFQTFVNRVLWNPDQARDDNQAAQTKEGATEPSIPPMNHFHHVTGDSIRR